MSGAVEGVGGVVVLVVVGSFVPCWVVVNSFGIVGFAGDFDIGLDIDYDCTGDFDFDSGFDFACLDLSDFRDVVTSQSVVVILGHSSSDLLGCQV